MNPKTYYVYIMSNWNNKVLYVGITGDLKARAYEHKNKLDKSSFTAKYNVNKLVYYETTDSAIGAIGREKQLKAGKRSKKVELINGFNPEWKDLSLDL